MKHGHFLVARFFKVKVLKFAIGFGPKVFTKVSKDTEYTLRLIPFGGFVQMEGEEKRSDDENAFNNKPIWQRILVVLAGPLVNIVFALLIYFTLVACQNTYQTSVIENLTDTEPAYVYGFRSGDEILKVNQHKVLFGWQVDEDVTASKTDEIIFTLNREGEKINLPVTLEKEKRGLLGVAFSGDRSIAYIYNNMPVASSGLELGDTVIAINGVTMYDVNQIVETIRSFPEQTIKITVIRDMETKTFEAETISNEVRALDLDYKIVTPSFGKGIYYALGDTIWYVGANIEAYGGLFKGNTDNVEVMGVVGIAGEISKTSAISEFFYLMCAISLSLGIFNLLPIPALDGGRILLLCIELIRRKPLSEKMEQSVILISFMIIILFAIVITFFDIAKFFR